MKYEVAFTQQAHRDLEMAFAWYENERAGLGWDGSLETKLRCPLKKSAMSG